MLCIAQPPLLPLSLQDKGDIVASAAAARAAAGASAGGAQGAPSAFQLVGGADGQPGVGSKAAAAAQAQTEQQRRMQLAAVPRAVDVLGIVGPDGSGAAVWAWGRGGGGKLRWRQGGGKLKVVPGWGGMGAA